MNIYNHFDKLSNKKKEQSKKRPKRMTNIDTSEMNQIVSITSRIAVLFVLFTQNLSGRKIIIWT